jgi:4-diphosphocytidyl-2-C-methyl-D-erythritol kinase
MAEVISIGAPAKINLSLRILGKRGDGFHELETLMAPITLADEIELMHGNGQEIQFSCNDPELPIGPENLCVKAAEAFRTATGLEHGIAISLMKRIPHCAGLGGGSSDAAAVLRGLNDLFDQPLVAEELHQIAGTLGSDVPFFLGDGPCWCRGRGEMLEKSTLLLERRILLIKPPFPVPTAWAYRRYAEMKEAGMLPAQVEEQSIDGITLVNDLEAPVFEKYLLLVAMKNWLRQQAVVEAAFMTGSGSTMVAMIAPDVARNTIAVLKEQFVASFGPTFWMCETSFRNA